MPGDCSAVCGCFLPHCGLRQLLALACIALAVAAFSLRRNRHARIPMFTAAVVGAILATTRLEVFEHEILAGWLSGEGQRMMIALGAGPCIGPLASGLVGALGPTATTAEIER